MTVYDSIPVTVTGGTLSDAEIAAYVKHSKKTYPNRKIEQLSIQVDGDFVDLRCQFAPENFERIRRITGYLVGTKTPHTNRQKPCWNNILK